MYLLIIKFLHFSVASFKLWSLWLWYGLAADLTQSCVLHNLKVTLKMLTHSDNSVDFFSDENYHTVVLNFCFLVQQQQAKIMSNYVPRVSVRWLSRSLVVLRTFGKIEIDRERKNILTCSLRRIFCTLMSNTEDNWYAKWIQALNGKKKRCITSASLW